MNELDKKNQENPQLVDMSDVEEARKAFIASEILIENTKNKYGNNLHDRRRSSEIKRRAPILGVS